MWALQSFTGKGGLAIQAGGRALVRQALKTLHRSLCGLKTVKSVQFLAELAPSNCSVGGDCPYIITSTGPVTGLRPWAAGRAPRGSGPLSEWS